MSDEKSTLGINILKKIIATIRSESRELSDAIFDSFGTGKLEQSYDTAKHKLQEAKSTLTEMMRKQRQCYHVLEITKNKIIEKEQMISQALSNGEDDEAFNYAQDVVELEKNKEIQIESSLFINANIEFLQSQLELSERELKEFSRQLSMIQTTENIQKATETIRRNLDGVDENLLSAKKSLNRIREKQQMPNCQSVLNKQLTDDQGLTKNITMTQKTTGKNFNNNATDIIRRIQEKK